MQETNEPGPVQTPRHTPPPAHLTRPLLSRKQGHKVHKNHLGHHAIAAPSEGALRDQHCPGITQSWSSKYSLDRRMTLVFMSRILHGNLGSRPLAVLPH